MVIHFLVDAVLILFKHFVPYSLHERLLVGRYKSFVRILPKIRVLLDNIERFDVEFLSHQENADDSDSESGWSKSYKGSVLPKAVAIEFDSKDFGTIRREFALTPGGQQS